MTYIKKNDFNDEIKVDIKICSCYYFEDITSIENFDFDILLDKNSYKNILVYDISYKTLIGAKLLHISFDQVDGFIRVYYGIRYSVLVGGDFI